MLIKKVKNIFICQSQYYEKDIPKGAGFYWHPSKDQCTRKSCIPCKLEQFKVWWTDNIENAFKLMKWADNDTKDLLQIEKEKREKSLEMSSQSHSNFSVKVPDGLNLYPFQIAGVEFMSQRDNTLLADEPGNGKTMQSIGLININNFNKILIVCPNTLKLNWKNELEKWLIKDYKIHIAESNLHSNIPDDINVIIINYDILLDSWRKKEYGNVELRPELKQEFDLLIADEIHKCKNIKTLRASLFYKIKAKKKVYLTGTPILNKVGELFYIINSLDHQTFPNYWKFLHQFTNFYHNGYGYVSEGGKNLDELNRLLRSTIMIRRLKKDVLKELPPKTRQIIEIPANGLENVIEKEQQTLATCEELLSRLKAELELSKLSDNPEEYRQAVKNLKMTSGIAFTEIARVRHETALAKLPLVIGYIRDLLEEHDKIVVFAHHRDVISTIFNNFKEIATYLTGECNIQHRQDAIDKFQNDPNIKIFIGSIQAAGVGITLTASNFVLFVEFSWVPSNMEQAIDRCVLEGQPILTKNGWIPIEDINIGDEIISHEGKLRKVIGKHKQQISSNINKRKIITELSIKGWLNPIRLTSDHKVLTSKGEWVEAIRLIPGTELYMPIFENKNDIEKIIFDEDCKVDKFFTNMAGKKQRKSRLIISPKHIKLDSEALFSIGYAIGNGYAVTDDKKGKFIGFSSHIDKKYDLKRIEKWISKYELPISYYYPKSKKVAEMRCYSTEWANWFAKNIGQGARNKKLPNWYINLSKNQSKQLIEGLMHSDGYYRKKRYEYITASDVLASQISILIRKAGYKPCIRKNSTNHWSIQYSLTDNTRNHPILSEIKSYIPRKIKGKYEYIYDLTIEEDESFVIGIISVHNCHRIGTINPVLAQYFVLQDSIDAKMAKITVEKQELIEKALGDIEIEIEKDEPIIPIEGITTTKQRIKQESRLITSKQIDYIVQGLKIIAGMDSDRASIRNDVGFSKVDTYIGNTLAQLDTLTNKQAALGRKLLLKYWRQLPEQIINNIKILKEN